MDFAKETGGVPCWPVHSAKRAEADILRRGKGGFIASEDKSDKCAYGFEVAEALAEHMTKARAHKKLMGLGFRFRKAIEELEEEGM